MSSHVVSQKSHQNVELNGPNNVTRGDNGVEAVDNVPTESDMAYSSHEERNLQCIR